MVTIRLLGFCCFELGLYIVYVYHLVMIAVMSICILFGDDNLCHFFGVRFCAKDLITERLFLCHFFLYSTGWAPKIRSRDLFGLFMNRVFPKNWVVLLQLKAIGRVTTIFHR